MIAVEFFDRAPIENAISFLTAVPDKIIYIGEQSNMKKYESVYKEFLEKRHLKIGLNFRHIQKNNLNNIIEVLSDIVCTEQDCVFDLTGGEDLVLVAMGIVAQKHKDKNIQMQRFNINKGKIYDCDNDGNVRYMSTPRLTVEENIRLHGGGVLYATQQEPDKTFLWDFSEDFVNDVNNMWSICRQNPGDWNAKVGTLEKIEEFLNYPDNLNVSVSLADFKNFLAQKQKRYIPVARLLFDLEKIGLVRFNNKDKSTITFTYKNAQVKKCLIKEGTVLELKVLTLANSIKNQQGEPYFTDCLSGVFIDWDGKVLDKNNTENEIDVILMRSMASLFISCKNGIVKPDELYKLDAVTNRFGTKYARKVLIATYLGKNTNSMEAVRQRATAMKITLLENVHLLDDDEFKQQIKDLIKP